MPGTIWVWEAEEKKTLTQPSKGSLSGKMGLTQNIIAIILESTHCASVMQRVCSVHDISWNKSTPSGDYPIRYYSQAANEKLRFNKAAGRLVLLCTVSGREAALCPGGAASEYVVFTASLAACGLYWEGSGWSRRGCPLWLPNVCPTLALCWEPASRAESNFYPQRACGGARTASPPHISRCSLPGHLLPSWHIWSVNSKNHSMHTASSSERLWVLWQVREKESPSLLTLHGVKPWVGHAY